MAVYVDDAMWPYGRMLMCHMMADRHSELEAMARLLSLDPEWMQARGSYREHYDVCKAKRAEAIRLGAREVKSRDLLLLTRRKEEEAKREARSS